VYQKIAAARRINRKKASGVSLKPEHAFRSGPRVFGESQKRCGRLAPENARQFPPMFTIYGSAIPAPAVEQRSLQVERAGAQKGRLAPLAESFVLPARGLRPIAAQSAALTFPSGLRQNVRGARLIRMNRFYSRRLE
jgi:hypothetical protein